ncbi:hypothetical protein PF011_g25491 [Phytophthora fragariae]|uniref:CCHC-type domain-containing protein n=1 Tax=Phytophthora fragariae TaxID=53985 RepID=A0A6A3HYG5_9STRA|nr:hypothetical protein PF011_g25491 [Phytophthora fragariae]
MSHDPGDGSMVRGSDHEDMPLQAGEDVLVAQETMTTTMSVQRSIGDHDARRQIDQLAQTAAAAHQPTPQQISRVQQHQDVIALKTSEYLQQQHERQLELQEQQEQIRRQMTEQRVQIEEHVRLLRAAEAGMGEHGQRLDSLAEAVRPHVEARWCLFARTPRSMSVDGYDEVRDQLAREPMVTLATGANMPVPPIYRGSSKKEKQGFMDSYMVYKRRVDALNQATQTQVFVMPIGACIVQSTLVRICRFELFKQESQVSEDDWKRYFLDARHPDYFAYQQLDVAMGTLAVVITLQDAESRMSRLLADFYSAVNGVNMESIIHEDSKRVVGYLVDALRPAVFRSAVKDSLARSAGKQLKKDVSQFLRWLRPQMEEFMKYETHILAARPNSNQQPQQPQQQHTKGKNFRRSGGKQGRTNGKDTHRSAATQQGVNSDKAPTPSTGRTGNPPRAGGARPGRSCFKCGGLTHSVFQCPQVKDYSEAKALFNSKTGKNTRPDRSVSAAGLGASCPRDSKRILPCRVMDAVDTLIKPDSGAEVCLIAPSLVKKLQDKVVWLPRRRLQKTQVVHGVGSVPLTIAEETNLVLRFETPAGPLVLRNVVCGICPAPHPAGVGDILLSDAVMERLGYDPYKLIESAQLVQSEYELGDIGAPDHEAGVCAYGMSAGGVAPEEASLSAAEDAVCFPVPQVGDPAAAVDQAMSAHREGIEDAKAKGASIEFFDALQTILEEKPVVLAAPYRAKG